MIKSFLKTFVVVLGLLLGWTAAAQALPVAAIAALLTTITGTAIAATSFAAIALTTVFNVALSIGLSYLAKALTPKPSTPDISSLPGGTTGKLQTGGAVPRTFGVGRYMTAGSLVYANTYSPAKAISAAAALSLTTTAGGNTPNAYLVQVIALSDIPVAGMAGLLVGGVPVTWSPSGTPRLEGYAVPEYIPSTGHEYLWVRFYDGTQIAADPTLVALFGSDPDRPFTSARIGTGVAYAVVTSLVNQDLFGGFPQCKFVLDGVPLYDRRYDTSVGGSGAQRWSDPTTWLKTANPVVIAENILRGVSYGGKWAYGAQTVTTTQLPSASWTAAASECDAAITLAAGGTEPQFVASGEIRFDAEPASTLEELLKACNGRLAEIGGSYKVRAGAPGSSVFAFTDNDILSTEQQTFDPFPSLGQIINAVTAKYISPAEGWNPKDAAPLYDATLETADGGRRQPVDINYSFVTSGTTVQRLMKAERDTHRAFRQHSLPMPPEAFVLEPLDVITWTSTRNGYSSKQFEVITADDLPNLNMGLSIKEIDTNAYDWVASTDEVPVTDGTLAILRPAPQPIVDWSAQPWTIHSDDVGRDLPGIKLTWDGATADVSGIRYEIRIKSTTEVVTRGETDAVTAGAIIIGANLIGNTVYQARGQYRPASVRDVSWSDWLDVTTPDVHWTLADFESSIRSYIKSLEDKIKAVQDAVQASALSSAEQDAHNLLDKATERGTLRTRTTEFRTGLASANAAITEVASIAADNEFAISSLQTSVTASFASQAASITTNSTAIAGIGGKLSASYGLELTVDGYVSGIYGYNAGAQIGSVFGVDADYFYVAAPGTTGGAAKKIFTIGTVDGAAGIGINGNVMIDGTVTAAKMNVGTLTAITASFGTATVSGTLTSPNGKMVQDYTNNRMVWYD